MPARKVVQPDALQGERFCRQAGGYTGRISLARAQDIDEFFFVLDGHFLIDLEDRVVDLAPRQGFVVPKVCAIAHARLNER